MAWDHGTVNGHGNAYWYGDQERLDGDGSFGIAVHGYFPSGTSGVTTNRTIFGKYQSGAGISGWYIRTDNSDGRLLLCSRNDGSGALENFSVMSAVAEDTEFAAFFRYDAVNQIGRAQVLGQPEKVTTGLSEPVAAHTREVFIGNNGHTGSTGAAMHIGHPMAWMNYHPGDEVVNEYFAGRIGAPANLSFWVTCIDETTANVDDKVFGDTGTEQGTVGVVARDFDSKFSSSGTILPHQFVGGMNMRLFSIAPGVLEVELPLEFLQVGLGDYFGVAHPDLPQAASVVDLIQDNYAADEWMQAHTFVLGRGFHWSADRMSVKLRLLDLTPKMAFFFATGRTQERGNDSGEGEAVWNQGWTLDNARNSTAYVVDTSELSDRKSLAAVAQFQSKTNHRGTLYEGAFKTLVNNNSALVDGAGPPAIADWAESLGTGGASTKVTLIGSTFQRLFRDDYVLGYETKLPRLTKGSAGDTVYELTITPDNTDDSRLYVWYMGSTGTLKWWLQRDTDSNYWTGSSWSASKTWISIGQGTINEIDRYVSDVISSVPASGAELTLGIGMEDGDGTSFTVLPMKVDFVQSALIVSDLVTLDSGSSLPTATSEADAPVWSIDNGGSDSRQTANYDHGRYRVDVYIEQDYDDLPNNTVHTLGEWGIDDNNKDILAINKDGSGNLRLVFVRYISGAQDALAEVSISSTPVRGSIHRAMGRWTSASGGELGLPARTLSALWDGVKGTDAQASGVHSSSDQTTHFRPGNSSQSGFDPAHNFLFDFELSPYAIADEAALGERRGA